MCGAREIAEAAEDHHRERLERRQVAHRRVGEEHGTQQGPGGGGERRAEREGHRVNAADLHAHERRRLAILEGRPHRPPQPRALDEEPGRRDQRQRGHHHEHAQRRDAHRPQREGRGGEGMGDGLGHAAPHQQLTVLQRDPEPDHDQHGGVDRLATQRREQQTLAERRPPPRPARWPAARATKKFSPLSARRGEGQVGPQRVELAVGEVDQVHEPEDQGEADAEQRIRAAQHQAIHQVLQKGVQD